MTPIHRPSWRMCCGHHRSEMPLFASLAEERVRLGVAPSPALSRLQQRTQEDARLLPSDSRDNVSGRGGVVRFRHLVTEQYESAAYLPRLSVVNPLRPSPRIIIKAPDHPQGGL